MSDLHTVAVVVAKPGSEEPVRAAMTNLAVASRAEEGCLAYDLFESGSAPGTFVTMERWRGQSDLDNHMQTPHIAAALAATSDHLAAAPGIHPLVPVT